MHIATAGFLVVVLFGNSGVALAQDSAQRAWDILEKGHDSRSKEERVNTVRALGQLPGNLHAVELAEQAIADKKPEVRATAALTLERLGSSRSIPLLKEALKDRNVKVAFAASSALLSLGDPSGYTIYREVLLGKRKSGEGPLEEEKRLIEDPKALTMMMLGVGAGFAPYAGYAWAGFEVLSKDYTGPVRVSAALKLATDRDPETKLALVKAASNHSWKVRVAALEALGQQADPLLMDTLASHLSDKKQVVRCAAASGVIRLSSVQGSEIQASALP
ncbi:MAG TPA: HEAT repeat domain-containing protein [Candidatus Sulfotelmatobacter sp.]|nr:HEAT repeat domain-containing protein [Candidatus Sulfotelmatobacter sp.]